MQTNNKKELFDNLNGFIKKYYFNKLLKGTIYLFSTLIIFFILFSTLEYFSRFNVQSRTFLFWSYLFINFIIITRFVIVPILQLLKIGKIISYKNAAQIIGSHFSEIDDKLINIIQLGEMSKSENDLINSSINQKISLIKPINFSAAISFSENKKYAKWIIIPLIIVALLYVSGKKHVLTESSARIVKHNTLFEPEAPFKYLFKNSFNVIQYEDWILNFEIVGREIPSSIYLMSGNSSFKLNEYKPNNYNFVFKSINQDFDFYLSAGGYKSKLYTVKVLKMPKVIDLSIKLDYPKYTKIPNNTIKNNGDLIIPEGTTVSWDVYLQNTEEVTMVFLNDTITKKTANNFKHSIKSAISSTPYQIITSNSNGLNDSLSYFMSIIKDEFPVISVTQEYDSISGRFLFNGEIRDDYAISKLMFFCEGISGDLDSVFYENIKIERLAKSFFYFEYDFNELDFNPGSRIKYYFSVWDNDMVNGNKKTNSQTFVHQEMTKDNIIKKKDAANAKTKNNIKKSLEIANEIKQDVIKLNKDALNKKEIGWEEEEEIRRILEKQKKLEKQIKKTQEQNSRNINNQEKLNSKFFDKQKELEKLMNELINEETKKMLEKMSELLNELDKEKLKSILEKIEKENHNTEKELDRELELFKQLEFEQKIEETIEKIELLKNKQKELNKKFDEDNINKDLLSNKQDSLYKEMTRIEKDIETLRRQNEKLENKTKIPETKQIEENIKEEMLKSKTSIQKNKKRQAKNAQKNTIKNIEKLKNLLDNIKMEKQEDIPIENMESLRQILDNLIVLSFDQEELISSVKNTPRNSHEFVNIIRNQNKLSENCKIIEDSLFALSKRVIQIESVVNKEINAINNNIEKVIYQLGNREINKSIEKQQFIMASINNLALLLSEILEQMQKDFDSSFKCNKPRNCNKPKNCNKPSMSELNKAQKKLNQKIKSSQKRGNANKNNAEKLMKLAKNQEEIRNQLLELRKEMQGGEEKGKIDEIIKKMDDNETDIINNQITIETIKRQEDILTRLLEAENANREKDTDKERKSFEWILSEENTTEKYKEYKKKKEAQEELLNTTPIQLKPYYKKKVNSYFKSLIQSE